MREKELKKKEFVDRLKGLVYSIEIDDNAYTRDTSEADPNSSYDRPDTSTSHNIEGFKVFEGDIYSDLQVLYEPMPGEEYYLLYVVYSTGDSFGHDSGGNIEYIGFYTEAELHIARENKRRIEEDEYSRGGSFSVDLLSQQGQEYQLSTPWKGYFESLDSVDIQTVRRLN